jgi:protein TonB
MTATLPISLALHAIAAAGFLASTIMHIDFPATAPRMTMAYMLAAPPPPPPPPPPPAPKQQPVLMAKQETNVLPMRPLDIAPTIIPDTIPLVVDTPPAVEVAELPAPTPGGSVDGVAGGSAGPHDDGVAGGVVGGAGDGPPPPPDRVVVKRDAKLPMHPMSQVYPGYPEKWRLRAVEDELVVRYLIGKDGRVKHVQVISHATKSDFEDAAVRAIGSWRFRPLMRDGQPVEVEHELTVRFKMDGQ